MSTLLIVGIALVVLVLIVGALFLYGACKNSAQEYALEGDK